MAVSGLTLQVWDAENQTYVGTLDQVVGSEMVDEFNAAGYGTCAVPLLSADADLLVKDAVIRVVYEGEVRFAWFVETIERELADGSNQYVLRASGRGLLGWLDDAIVYPQAGLADFIAVDRPFNFAAKDGTWRQTGDFSNALGVRWDEDDTAREKLPIGWKDPAAQWIWKTDPTEAVQRGTVNYMRRTFTLSESKRIKFWASCDNFMEVYLDGTLIMSSTNFDDNAASFTQIAKFTTRLGAGEHTLAARVRNDKAWEAYDVEADKDTDKFSVSNHGLVNGTLVRVTSVSKSDAGVTVRDYYVRQRTDGDFKLATANNNDTIVNVTKDCLVDIRLKADNTAGFLLTAYEIDDTGKATTHIVRTNTNWTVSEVEPQWLPALILKALIQEAAERKVYRLDRITFGFTQESPTAGTWDTKADLSLSLGTSLLSVMDDMVDLGHDFWLNPTSLELEAWESRGTDLSATVLIDTGINVLKFSTTAEPKLKTAALIKTRGGWTQKVADTAETGGRREAFLEYGNTRSDTTARNNADKVLKRTGKTQLVANTVDAAVVPGAVPYVDFSVGDLVSVPPVSGEGVRMKARVLSIGLKDDGGSVTFSPELEVITSA